jgi:sortase A
VVRKLPSGLDDGAEALQPAQIVNPVRARTIARSQPASTLDTCRCPIYPETVETADTTVRVRSGARRGARIARAFGTLLVVLGVAGFVWAFVIWQWNDPFTGLYTRYQQHKLARSYAHVVAAYHPRPVPHRISPLAEQRLVATEAGRYRLAAHTGSAIGRIDVPRLGLHMVLVNGTDHDSLVKGPGRDQRTFMPGQGQLVYIAGHRTTYLAPFAHIDSLRPGDRITLRMPYATVVYSVTGHVIVDAHDLAVLRTHNREQLALQACHPRFFATHRYIVWAKPVQVTLPDGHRFTPRAHLA